MEDVRESEFLDLCRLSSTAVIDRSFAYIASDIFLLGENGFIHVQLLAQLADEVVEHCNVRSQSSEPRNIYGSESMRM